MTGARPVTTRADDLTWHDGITAEHILAEWRKRADYDPAGRHMNRAAALLHAGDRIRAAGELELAAGASCQGDSEHLCRMAISLARGNP